MYTHTGHTGLIRVILVSYWSHTCHTGIIHVMLVSIYVLYCSYIHILYLLQMQERGEDRKLFL